MGNNPAHQTVQQSANEYFEMLYSKHYTKNKKSWSAPSIQNLCAQESVRYYQPVAIRSGNGTYLELDQNGRSTQRSTRPSLNDLDAWFFFINAKDKNNKGPLNPNASVILRCWKYPDTALHLYQKIEFINEDGTSKKERNNWWHDKVKSVPYDEYEYSARNCRELIWFGTTKSTQGIRHKDGSARYRDGALKAYVASQNEKVGKPYVEVEASSN